MLATCSICCDNIDFANEEISVLHCGHLFHQTCLPPWLNTSSTCPDCRAKVGKHGFVKKIYAKVNGISYDGVSNETKHLFKVYEEQAKNMQKLFLERFVALEKDLSKEKLSHAKTLKELGQQRRDNLNILSELQQLRTENDDIRSAKNNYEQLRLENESLKKKMSSVINFLQNKTKTTTKKPNKRLQNGFSVKPSTSKFYFVYVGTQLNLSR